MTEMKLGVSLIFWLSGPDTPKINNTVSEWLEFEKNSNNDHFYCKHLFFFFLKGNSTNQRLKAK